MMETEVLTMLMMVVDRLVKNMVYSFWLLIDWHGWIIGCCAVKSRGLEGLESLLKNRGSFNLCHWMLLGMGGLSGAVL